MKVLTATFNSDNSSTKDLILLYQSLRYKLKHGHTLSPVDRHLTKHFRQLQQGFFRPSLLSVFSQLGQSLLKPLLSVLALLIALSISTLEPQFRPSEPAPHLAKSDITMVLAGIRSGAQTLDLSYVPNSSLAVHLAEQTQAENPAPAVISVPRQTAVQTIAAINRKPPNLATVSYSSQPREVILTDEFSPERGLTKFLSGLIHVHRPQLENSALIAQQIVDLSISEKIDPFFIAAVVSIESRFHPDARSSKGASGLMQLMPATAKALADEQEAELANPRHVSDPLLNLTLGSRYLKQLEAKYNGDLYLALAAYNWGPGNITRVQGKRERLPRSVRKYAAAILERSKSWKLQYNEALQLARSL